MTPEINDISDLKLKLSRTSGKPASFLVGAPFSWDNGEGVPPVDGFIDIIRAKVLAKEGPKFAEQLEQRLAGTDAAARYQEAMGFVYRVLDADVVAEIVQEAVLSARRVGAPALDPVEGLDGEPADWILSRGQRGLASLIKLSPDRFTGPIFTTNFDPLIGQALTLQGIRYHPLTIPLEGSLNAPIRIAQDDINVFHLHGYWRDSPTLHSPQQLETKRDQLQASLEKHFNQTNLVVMAYSGWDDIFTSALANCLSSDSFKGTVTWCFYGGSPAEIREQNTALFDKFKAGIQQERITFFCGVNCHTFFDDLINDLGLDAPGNAPVENSPLAGWELVAKERLESLDPLTGEEAVRFFDGAVPTWRHAISPLIPRLSHAETIFDRVKVGLESRAASTLQLVRAAGGEGKSTALLQAAVSAADGGDCTVLHRLSPDTGLNPDVVEALDPDRQWLLVADDAEGLIGDLWECAVRLHDAGRRNVFFLLAARDADWIAEKGNQRAWNGRLNRLDDLVLGGISEADAGQVVDAWAEQGDTGLRGLIDENSRDERVNKLMISARAQDVKGGEGSFFGGLLDARFSDPALIDHVVTLMEPLRHREIEGGTGTLYDALLYIANCHAVGMPGLDKRVLASIGELPVIRVSSSITTRLGGELGVAESRGHILTRHKRVAQALIAASETHFGNDIASNWVQLIQHTVTLGKSVRYDPGFHSFIVHSGARLMHKLPELIEKERRGEIGIVAAEASMDAEPERISGITDMARGLRFAGRSDEACRLLKSKLPKLKGSVDLKENIRGYFYEWSTCAGRLESRLGSIEDAWLAAFALSDNLKVELTAKTADLVLAGLGVAFGDLMGADSSGAFALGRRAIVELGWKVVRNEKGAGYFGRYEQELDHIGTPKPDDLDQALGWLMAAAEAAHRELTDPLLISLQKNGRLPLSRLKSLVITE